MAMLKILGLFLLLALVEKLVLCQSSAREDYSVKEIPDASTFNISSDNELTHVRTKNLSGNVRLTTLQFLPTNPPLDQDPSRENKQDAVQTITENQSQVALLSELRTKAPTDGWDVFNSTSGTLPTTEKPITVTSSNLDQIQEDSSTPEAAIYAEKNTESSTFPANLTRSADSENATQTDVFISTSMTTNKREDGAAFSNGFEGISTKAVTLDFGDKISSNDKDPLSRMETSTLQAERVNSDTVDMFTTTVNRDSSVSTQVVTQNYTFDKIRNTEIDTMSMIAHTSADQSIEDITSFIHVDEELLSTVSDKNDEVTDENIEDVSLILKDDEDIANMDKRFDFGPIEIGKSESLRKEQFSGFLTNRENSKIENEEIDQGLVSASTATDFSTPVYRTEEDTSKSTLTIVVSTEGFSALPNFATTEESTEFFNDVRKNMFDTTVTGDLETTSTISVSKDFADLITITQELTTPSESKTPTEEFEITTENSKNNFVPTDKILSEPTTTVIPEITTSEFSDEDYSYEDYSDDVISKAALGIRTFMNRFFNLKENDHYEEERFQDDAKTMRNENEDENKDENKDEDEDEYYDYDFDYGDVPEDVEPEEDTASEEEDTQNEDQFPDNIPNTKEEFSENNFEKEADDELNTDSKTFSTKSDNQELPSGEETKNDEYLLANLTGRIVHFRIRIVYNKTSFFIPSNADIEVNSPNVLNIRWQSSTPNRNNSLKINLGHSLQLNIVKGTQTHIYKKSLSSESENKLDVDTTEVTLDDGIRIYFSNIEVSKTDQGNRTASSADVWGSTPQQIGVLSAKIIGGAVSVFLLTGLICVLNRIVLKHLGGRIRSFKPNEVSQNV